MAVAAGLDGVLGYVGAPHPCVTVHLLLALGNDGRKQDANMVPAVFEG